jgi:hypothetical protein
VFLRQDAAREVADAAEVFRFAAEMFADESLQRAIGIRGRDTVLQNRGASARTAARIVELLA